MDDNINAEQLGRDKILGKIREVFEREGDDFDGENINEGDLSVENKPKDPDFPIFILLLAIIKDILDWLILFYFIGLLIQIIIFFWGWGKIKFGGFKKMIIRTILIMIIEFIPGFSLIPTETFFVLMLHFREKKLVKLFNLALEELRNDVKAEVR